MENILLINACVRPESRTLRLARCVLEELKRQEASDSRAEEIDLASEAELRPLDLARLAKRDALIRDGKFSDPMFRYARQFAGADVIVLAAPFWDLSFPAAVKVFYENIMVLGLTFSYTEEGIPAGLCRARKFIYVTTAGGPMPAHNCGFEYVKALNDSFLGIPETEYYYADQLDIVGVDAEGRLAEAMQGIGRGTNHE